MCGTHFLCPHHACLPMKKRKFLIEDISADECSISDDSERDVEEEEDTDSDIANIVKLDDMVVFPEISERDLDCRATSLPLARS
jgi:hypothetical protein